MISSPWSSDWREVGFVPDLVVKCREKSVWEGVISSMKGPRLLRKSPSSLTTSCLDHDCDTCSQQPPCDHEATTTTKNMQRITEPKDKKSLGP